MKTPILATLALLALSPIIHAADDCCAAPLAATGADTTLVTHPIKGVIVDILPERSALLVKHEEIPGFMKAMTMLFKVDADTLKSVQKGQAITGVLVKKDTGWWLENVAPAAQ